MPTNEKQTRALLGGIDYYRKFLDNLSKRLSPITALLKQGVKFIFTLAMKDIVRQVLHDLDKPPVLVFPDWDAVADNSRPFRLYYDASRDGFGATLEQEEQPDGSVHPILFISRSTLDNKRSWTPLDLEAGSIVLLSAVLVVMMAPIVGASVVSAGAAVAAPVGVVVVASVVVAVVGVAVVVVVAVVGVAVGVALDVTLVVPAAVGPHALLP